MLGPLQVASLLGTPLWIGAAKQRTILAVLLTRPNQVVSADVLVHLVWDGHPPRADIGTLRTHVMRLRETLGSSVSCRIATAFRGYQIEVDQDDVDLTRFERLVDAGRRRMREGCWPEVADVSSEALNLWRGEPLVDVPSQLLRAQQVPRLERLRLQACEWQVEANLRLGRLDDVLAQLCELASAYPYHEHLQAQLMRALSRCGRRAEALAAYQQARRILVAELGVEPGDELRELHRHVCRGDAL
jgi:DNA-binding SARP family transcriptional activator